MPRAPARVPRGVAGVVGDDDRHRERGCHRLHGGDHVAPVGGTARTPPAGLLRLARSRGCPRDAAGRARRHTAARASSASGRGGHARDRRRAERTARTEDETELVDRDVLVATRDVAPQRVDEAREDRRAQQRPLLGQRVGQPDRVTTVVVGGQHELVGELLRHERVAEDLGQPGPGQRVGDDPTGLLLVGQAATVARGRRDRRDVVVAVDPRDLLGVVGRVDEVGSPRRRRHEHVRLVGALAGLVDRAAEVAQDADDALAGVVDAHDARRAR